MPDRWTPETEAVVNAVLVDGISDPADIDKRLRLAWPALTLAILTALADAGVLLPPGGERREDWGVRYPNGEVIEAPDEDDARDMLTPALTLVRRDRIVWTDGADYRGPWTVADQITPTNPEAIA